jgi:hypothetical protein
MNYLIEGDYEDRELVFGPLPTRDAVDCVPKVLYVGHRASPGPTSNCNFGSCPREELVPGDPTFVIK